MDQLKSVHEPKYSNILIYDRPPANACI